MLNGFPVRLIVPGYYGTYWANHLSSIELVDETYEGFWMKPAYRNQRDGARLRAAQPITVRGIA